MHREPLTVYKGCIWKIPAAGPPLLRLRYELPLWSGGAGWAGRHQYSRKLIGEVADVLPVEVSDFGRGCMHVKIYIIKLTYPMLMGLSILTYSM